MNDEPPFSRKSPRDESEPGPLSSTPSLPELCYRHIRSAIITQQFRPDQWLKQEEIARDLGVSRLPVREALRRLDAEGLVRLKSRHGYYVVSLDADEIAEVFAIRAMLEGRIGYLAAQKVTDEDVLCLTDLLARMDELDMSERESMTAFGRMNFNFHDRIYELSGMNHARRILHRLNDIAERYVRMSLIFTNASELTRQEHAVILDAIRDRDPDRAEAACRLHCEETGGRLVEELRKALPQQ